MDLDHAPRQSEPATDPRLSTSDSEIVVGDETLEASPLTLDETQMADDFAAGTDAPLGRAGVERALANG